MPDRRVRFTDSFFDRLDSLFAEERGDDGSSSATDFPLYDIPRVRDRLAADFERNTLATDDPDVYVYIGAGRSWPRSPSTPSVSTTSLK